MDLYLGGLIIALGYICALLYVPLQIVAIIVLRGPSRLMSLIPIPFAILIAVVTIMGYYQNSNLWPICMIFCSPCVVGYLILCFTYRKPGVQRRRGEMSGAPFFVPRVESRERPDAAVSQG